MRVIAVVAVILMPTIAAAAPWVRGEVGPAAPIAVPPTAGQLLARPETHPIDPQAGEAWGGDLGQKLDAASGRTWRGRGATVQVGYQQRDFAPQPPDFDGRGYDHMLKKAPDMAGLSLSLRTR